MYKLFWTTQQCVEFIMKEYGVDELEASHAAVWSSKYLGAFSNAPEWRLDLRTLADYFKEEPCTQ